MVRLDDNEGRKSKSYCICTNSRSIYHIPCGLSKCMDISCMAQHNSVSRNGTTNGEIRRWPQHGYKATENPNEQAFTQVLVHGHFANNTRWVGSMEFRHS